MKSLGKILLAAGAAIGAYKMFIVVQLKHFRPSEFGLALPFLAIGLLLMLDDFREKLGRRVWPSKAEGSMIRFGGDGSQHYYGRAIDIILEAGTDIEEAVRIAEEVGFTGIGVYPNSGGVEGRWRMHLDIRPGKRVATWGKVNGQYAALDDVVRQYG